MKAMHILRAAHFFSISYIVTAYTGLSEQSLKALPRPGPDFDIVKGRLLSPILQPRVPGSSGSTAVLNHFAEFFKTDLPQWHVTYQNSTSKTPVTGDREVPFVNMIATRDPPWSKAGEVGYLTIVAHYDSKMSPEGFIGATDSAAPCAMLMHTARSLDGALTKKWAAMKNVGVEQEDYDLGLEEHTGLKIIFLDGEEAFATWTNQDSIYGAKSLAAEMEAAYHPALSTYHNAISSISLFVLLDLLGSSAPDVPSYFKTTHWAYEKMADLEDRFRHGGLFLSSPNHDSQRSSNNYGSRQVRGKRAEPKWLHDLDKSNDRWSGGMIGDDHVPFMARGVDILHVIPSPFPKVWHHPSDDGEHLDMDTTEDWAVLVTAFAAEWLDLEGYLDDKAQQKRRFGDEKKSKATRKTEL
ncbi:hypothetical protein ACLMJK_006181 [Lecanora helva]